MPEKSWRAELSKSALKALKKIPKKTSARILNSLEELEEMENPMLHKDVRPLTGKLRGFHRLRVGEFRIIFEPDPKGKRLGVHVLVHRGSAY